jgi:hypothetical protein
MTTAVTATPATVDVLDVDVRSLEPTDSRYLARAWDRSLRAQRKSPNARAAYGESLRQLTRFPNEQGMPLDATKITREHVEHFIADLAERRAPATANKRYMSPRSFFVYLEEEGDIAANPMAKMRPPTIPEKPIAIIDDETFAALLKACAGTDVVAQPLGAPFRGDGGIVLGVAFSPDGKTLAISTSGGALIIYDLATHRALHTYTSPQSLDRAQFNPDGKTLAIGTNDGETLLIDPTTGRPRGEPLTGHSEQVLDIHFSGNGRTLATGSFDGTVILYDVASRQPIGDPLDAGYGGVAIAEITPDGHILASSYLQGQVVIWDINPDSWQRRACARAGRNLTRDEWRQYLGTRRYHKTCAQWPAGT